MQVFGQTTSSDSDTPCASPTITGTKYNDVIEGTPGVDIIDARIGNDVVHDLWG
jgi:hypothetical protein